MNQNNMVRGDIDLFLSCSFAPVDTMVHEFIRSICTGLRFVCVNVATGFAALPPEKAKEYIAASAGLLAIATRRDLVDGGEFIMPSAVREEISMAYGLGKRVLILGEVGVRFDGFMNNYGTRLLFSRDDLTSPAFIEKVVLALYTFREDVTASMHPPQYATEYLSESTRTMTALNYDGSDYCWTVATTKRWRFEATLLRDINSGVWPIVPCVLPADAPSATWTVSVDSSSRPFQAESVVKVIAADRVMLAVRFEPTPQPGDVIEFTRTFKSKYLNPLFNCDIPVGPPPPLMIGDRAFPVAEGQVVAERTRKFHLHYTFPEEYGLRPEHIAPFVASHSYMIDYLAPWELERVGVSVELFGRRLIVDLRVDEPQPRHIYGLAWSLPR